MRPWVRADSVVTSTSYVPSKGILILSLHTHRLGWEPTWDPECPERQCPSHPIQVLVGERSNRTLGFISRVWEDYIKSVKVRSHSVKDHLEYERGKGGGDCDGLMFSFSCMNQPIFPHKMSYLLNNVIGVKCALNCYICNSSRLLLLQYLILHCILNILTPKTSTNLL